MSIATTPTKGGRLELTLTEQTDAGFVYAVELLWPEGRATGTARVSLPEGVVDLTADGAPAWLLKTTTLFLRGLYRDARDGEPLPRRVTRWREDPAAR